MWVVTAPAVVMACSAGSLPLRARRPRSSEDATLPLLPGLIGLGRVASSLPYDFLSMILCRHCCGGGGAPDPVCCPAVFSSPSPLQDRSGTENSL
ncbi:hypothetical protein NDU88_000215 [Pleurodeles waltl]|uniref:Secreted protein n=1 Tax=Pleurodeles waltl TaxID=8319 RepID=A0AAV7TG15_PLEWA|nr:hypothetical protein NDU88_000215 [Pleurodeles waltl]